MLDSVPIRLLFTAFLSFYLVAMLFYHFMVFRVNRHLEIGEKFRHSMSFGQRERLRDLYQTFYPRSPVYRFTMTCAVMIFVVALAFVGFSVWQRYHRGCQYPFLHGWDSGS